MNTEMILIIGVVAIGGFFMWQSSQRAAQLQAAQMAALAAQNQRQQGGFFGTIGQIFDQGAGLFGVELPAVGS